MAGIKHEGTLEDLKTIVGNCGFDVDKVKEKDNFKQVKTQQGAIVSWWPSTGTIQFQGKKKPKEELEDAWRTCTNNPEPKNTQPNSDDSPPVSPQHPDKASKKVFVVHGHDDASREQLELILHKLELNPFVLANTGGGGLTIIEALEEEIGPEDNKARFGIVLLTPDDMGYAKEDGDEEKQPRARQNAILELGMLISAIGRRNIAILKKGHLEIPSDTDGMLYIPFNDHVKETVPKLTNRLREAGFVLSSEAITRASS